MPKMSMIIICTFQSGAERVMIWVIIVFDAGHDFICVQFSVVNRKARADEAVDQPDTCIRARRGAYRGIMRRPCTIDDYIINIITGAVYIDIATGEKGA